MSDEEPSRPLMAPRKVRVLRRGPATGVRRRSFSGALWLLLACTALVIEHGQDGSVSVTPRRRRRNFRSLAAFVRTPIALH
ncbi:hypothetical protein HPB52_013571 [Rhipicephalus sanguineus]|uniref:Uncharacterized protein n=1 Tax=Rhipicephalus sanguineus TaxID=34632 RepID=A0A9D4SWB3_RHISA|nr:hypothetical protein HPB52_013571 [Rhipicephalus sanguineus]